MVFEGLKAAKLLENVVSGAFSTFCKNVEKMMPKWLPKSLKIGPKSTMEAANGH